MPRRAGERGALDAGAAPTLLPGGRPVADAAARAEVEAAWGLAEGALPAAPGRDTDAILAAAGLGELAALVVGGLDPYDLADPAAALAGLREVGFLVSLEMLRSPVTELADVVLPVAPDAQRAGTLPQLGGAGPVRSGPPSTRAACCPTAACSTRWPSRWTSTCSPRPRPPRRASSPGSACARGRRARGADGRPRAVRARPASGRPCWPRGASSSTSRRSRCDEPHLAGTARPALVRVNAATAARLGLTAGAPATVRTERGAITLPVALADLPDGVVWLPGNSGESRVRAVLGVGHGDLVGVTA